MRDCANLRDDRSRFKRFDIHIQSAHRRYPFPIILCPRCLRRMCWRDLFHPPSLCSERRLRFQTYGDFPFECIIVSVTVATSHIFSIFRIFLEIVLSPCDIVVGSDCKLFDLECTYYLVLFGEDSIELWVFASWTTA